MRRVVALALASILGVGLVACSSKNETAPAQAAKSLDAAATVEQSVALLREGNIAGVLQTAVPEEHYARIKADWKAKIAEDPASEEDRREFAETMARLTASDAEEKLYAELEPALAKAEAEMAAQLPLMIGMGRGFAVQAINESATLKAEQKQQAIQLLDAFAKWAESARFFDRDKARQAIAVAVKTARSLELRTMEEVEALEFEQAMDKAGKVFLGFRDVLKVYDLDLDAALASVDASVLKEAGDEATVKVDYTLFGQKLSAETQMQKRGERWYGAEALREIDAKLGGGTAPLADDVDESAE